MKIKRAFKVRLYPTAAQQDFLDKTLGCCRFLYNKMLAERIETYQKLKDNPESLYAHKYKTVKGYRQEYAFLKEADAVALQQARRDLDTAYKNFFASLKGLRKGKKAGFPCFKSKYRHNAAYRTGISNGGINFEEQTIRLPKIKESVRFKHEVKIKPWYRQAVLKSITVSRTPSGKYFASCLFEGEQDFQGFQEKRENVIGLDMSLRNFYVDNLGGSPEYRQMYRENEKKIGMFQARLARKPKDSRNREKARLKVARLYERIKNYRQNFIDTLSYRLVQEYDVIVVEHLSLKGMSQSMGLGKPVMDAAYGAFVEKLQYKALWHDKTVLIADRWFASSKICHVCGYKKKDLSLNEREWTCPACGTAHDRDKNAAINLAQLGNNLPAPRRDVTPMDTAAPALVGNGNSEQAPGSANP